MNKEGNEDPSQGGGDPSKKDPNADLYENRGSKKIIRLVTVVAYMFSVSFVAIVLSAYYLFLWEPPNPNLIRRPIHLSADPEAQFLIGEPSDFLQHATDDPRQKPVTEHKGSNNFGKSLSARIVDNSIESGEKKHRRTLNESLALLRNTLIEHMRNVINDSKVSSSSSTRVFNNDTNDDRSKSIGNSSVTENATRSEDILTVNAIVARGQSKRSISERDKDFVDRVIEKKCANVTRDETNNALNDFSTVEHSLKTNRSKMIDKPAAIPSVRGKDSEIRGTGNERSDLFRRSLQRQSAKLASFANHATNYKETQIEKMTIKTTTVRPEGTGTPEIVTIDRQKSLLTILTETNDATPFTITEDFETNSSIESKGTSTETETQPTIT